MADSPEAGLRRLNALAHGDARAQLRRCCGSSSWVEEMMRARPFANVPDVYATALRAWAATGPDDWREAFGHHPRIGDRSGGAPLHANTRAWSAKEQDGVAAADAGVIEALRRGNAEYEARFGHVFLVCATGRSADEMLALLRERMQNPPDAELRVAAAEQAKITRLRLEKLLREED
jgi:2-oxo-4-hydroxy-4-carboxy-5-ureidoimidazoline decarboxylase